MSIEEFAERILTAQSKARQLTESVGEGGCSAAEAWPETVEELQVTLEELRVAEEELHEQNDTLLSTQLEVEIERQRYRELFETAPIAYLVTNVHGTILEANRAAADLFQVSKQFLEGKPMVSFMPPSERRDLRSALLILEREGGRKEWKIILRPRNADEAVHTIALAETALPDMGTVPTIRWLLRDVTQQVRAEDEIRQLNAELEGRVEARTAELQAANQRMRGLLSMERAAREKAERLEMRHAVLSRIGTLLGASLDSNEHLSHVAEALTEQAFSGCEIVLLIDGEPTVVTAAGTVGEDLPPPPERPGVDAALETMETQHTVWPGPGDTRTPVMVTPMVVNGDVLGMLFLGAATASAGFTASDVWLADETARRCAMALEAAALYHAEQNAGRAKEEFLAILGHELRNPLAPIRHAVELAAALDIEDPRLRRVLDVVDRQSRRIGRVVDDLADVSNISTGRLEIRLEKLDLAATLAEVVDAEVPTATEKGIELTLSRPESPVIIEGDAARLAQIFSNLIGNAIKYTGEGGQITVALGSEGARAVVSVRDTGMGISPDGLPHIFEMFHREARARGTVVEGLGIGLTLVRRLVRMHGGEVSACSAGESKGAEFTVNLPLKTESVVPS